MTPSRLAALALLLALPLSSGTTRDALREGFLSPPAEAKMRCYWWWLNGNTDEPTITRDLEQMKAKGYGGALLVDADGSGQRDNHIAPEGPTFGSPRWRELYVHALKEAARLGLEISLNIESGWNLGGPDVKPEDGAKLLTWSKVTVHGPATINQPLPQPKAEPAGFYRDIAVMAYPLLQAGVERKPIRQLQAKAAATEFGMSMPVTTSLLEDIPSTAGEEDTHVADVRDVSDHLISGRIAWKVPAGDWEILRIGYTASGARISTSSGKWQGLAIDYMDRSVFEGYWTRNVVPLLRLAKPYIGKSLKYLVTDSWELGGLNWTPRFREEFRARRGYDVLPYLPVVAGRIVDSRATSNRFLNDLRRTVGDLVITAHYQPFAEMAAKYGLGIHPESGGPHGAPIDALETLGLSAFPQTEYWAPSKTHRVRDDERFFLKEASSAAHTYGKTFVGAEGMTSIGPHWEETPATLRPAFDQAITEGMNRLIWHTFTSSPKSMGLPGQEYFAGTHLNPNVTWWEQAGTFVSYINRVQFLMQQGRPVSDVVYYYGDHVPNFVRLKAADPAKVLPGFDYDVADEHVLTTRLSTRDGALVTPDGVSYRLLVLPDIGNLSVSAIQAVRQLVNDGAAVLGSKPLGAVGLRGNDEVRRMAAELWGDCGVGGVTEHRFGKGIVFCSLSSREALARMGVAVDFEGAGLDYVHRRTNEADIYFVRNTRNEPISADVFLRVSGKQPESWDSENGQVEPVATYVDEGGRTRIPLHLSAQGSTTVVMRRASGRHAIQTSWRGDEAVFRAGLSQLEVRKVGKFRIKLDDGSSTGADVASLPAPVAVNGPWAIAFRPGWGAPPALDLKTLASWTEQADNGIKYYSGTATYSTRFQLPEGLSRDEPLYLNLGDVRELADVWLNGQHLGVVWRAPFLLPLSGAARPGWNDLRVNVVNLWPNRLIGDAALPASERLTHTNITKFKPGMPLLPSGLLGPVTVEFRRIVPCVNVK